jgi:hypothetical protein
MLETYVVILAIIGAGRVVELAARMLRRWEVKNS